MTKKEEKTNVMRLLDKEKIAYTAHEYDHSDGAIDGVAVAQKLGQDPAQVFKTLVTRGASGSFFVFCIPVAKELDFKKAAKSVKEKSVAMIHVAEINQITGYIRGGCSPLGMKKRFITVFDESVLGHTSVMVSAGKIGYQVEAAPKDLMRLCNATAAPLTMAE
ncbi:MAG: Cys-tRNA(Pro) deacylase [Pygmaiobacter massiliensis]|uniref:Cys-tRNA(Pro) deacylase n=1 Tax=Pygmaiobacter massiliensis TaxID=1917873 RepID=UPI0028A12A96|nr:Cys-tRNA(Pro) deacylase [Pygmaiobacter massiliensis]